MKFVVVQEAVAVGAEPVPSPQSPRFPLLHILEQPMARPKKSPSSLNELLATIALEALFALIQTGNPLDPKNVAKAMNQVLKRSRKFSR
jgi:hypothetical protein